MFGPTALPVTENATAAAAAAATPWPNQKSNSEETAAPAIPSWSTRRRPSRVSATCPHAGVVRTLASAVAAITSPISLSDRPRLERNGAKNG
jgi:hypothetical protein